MKVLGLILFVLIVLLQYSLWQGKGSWNRVWETSQKVASQKEANQRNESEAITNRKQKPCTGYSEF